MAMLIAVSVWCWRHNKYHDICMSAEPDWRRINDYFSLNGWSGLDIAEEIPQSVLRSFPWSA